MIQEAPVAHITRRAALAAAARGLLATAPSLANTRRQPADEMMAALDNLVWAMARKVSGWQL